MNEKKRRVIECLHVCILTQFAFIQPLLYRLSRKTVYLEDQGIDSVTVLLLVAFLCLIVPLILWLLVLGAGKLSTLARERTYDAIVFILLVLIVLPVLKLANFLAGLTVLCLSVVLAFLALLAYRRFAWTRLLVTAAIPAIVVFPGHFLWLSPASHYLFPRSENVSDPAAVQNPVPIVIVLFDELCGTSLLDRHGEIDAVRYPNFTALAQTATWYRNATSVHPRTEMAVPAILTGNYPRGPRPATVAEYPSNLFELLDSTGRYDFIVFEPYTRLCRPRQDEKKPDARPRFAQLMELARTLPLVYMQHLFPVDLPFVLPDVPMEWYAVKRAPPQRPHTRTGVFRFRWNADRAQQFDEFLRRIEPSGRPALYFLHIVLPHFPWCFMPSGHSYTPDDGRQLPLPGTSTDNETWGNDPLTVLHAYQRYLLQLGYADHLLGKLIEQLRSTELLDQCLFIVTADHGVSFLPGRSRRLPDSESLPDIAAIPLFIKLPQQKAGQTSDRNVESIDVFPTILDVLEHRQPPRTDGSSLLDPTAPERTQKRFFDDVRIVSIPAAFPARQNSLSRLIELCGDGSEPGSLFRVGPHNELIGRSVEDQLFVERTEIQLILSKPSLGSNQERLAFSPSYFSGRIRSRELPKQPITIAIAINGVIRAVTRTYADKKIADAWTAIVPETAFQHGGDNVVRFFVVNDSSDPLTLHPFPDDDMHIDVPE